MVLRAQSEWEQQEALLRQEWQRRVDEEVTATTAAWEKEMQWVLREFVVQAQVR